MSEGLRVQARIGLALHKRWVVVRENGHPCCPKGHRTPEAAARCWRRRG